MTTASAPTLASLAEDLGAAGVPTLVLRGAGPPAVASSFSAGRIELLIPGAKRRVALSLFNRMNWRYQIGNIGTWRLLPFVHYWWPEHVNVFLYWGLPAAPLPARMLRRLERQLWAFARPIAGGLVEPDPASMLVHLAVQASRPRFGYHRDEWRHFCHCIDRVDDWSRVWEVAAEARVAGTVARALAAARVHATRPPEAPVFDARLKAVWRAAMVIQRNVRPHWLRALLAGAPRLGEAIIRCRIAGIEVLAGPRVFVPTPDADLFVKFGAERIDVDAAATVIEVGTGSGAIALALARARRGAEVHAVDTSRAALRWARRNRRRLQVDGVRFYRGSLLAPLPREIRGSVSIIIANLPFYPSDQFAPIGAVPRETIQGSGDDGLHLLRQLARDARVFLRPAGCLLLQMFDWQWERFAPELASLGYEPGAPIVSGPFTIGPAEITARYPL